MKNIIGKILCWLGIHKIDEDEWHDSYSWVKNIHIALIVV